MLFNSLHYLIFFPIVVALYFLLPFRLRWILLLVASYIFYGFWRVEYLLLLIYSTIIDYYTAFEIDRSTTARRKKIFLWLGLANNLGLLGFFKYFGFLLENITYATQALHITDQTIHLKILLPVGISFYTFQSMAYLIDVYRGLIKAEKNFGIYAVFVAFFPQLVAGPIQRSQHMLPQFKVKHEFSYENVKYGLMLFAWGLFKKVVIADRVSYFVNLVYNHPNDYFGWHIILATLFFTVQIYCDFSGYSDMAIGSARIMGFDLAKNFNLPQHAINIGDFWRRWHMSLSTWLKDYVYFPLGGSRVVKWRMYYNLFLTFFVSGIWHGANWTFVVYGILHGTYIVYESSTRSFRAKFYSRIGLNRNPLIYTTLMVAITFTVVCFTRIFFRANTISDAWVILNHLFVIESSQLSWTMFGPNYYNLLISLFAVLLMESIHLIQARQSLYGLVCKQPTVLRWSMYVILLVIIINFGVFTGEDFIYFQF